MSLIRCALVMAPALALSGGGHLLSAQQGLGGRGLGLYGVGPRLGENVELALEFQDLLGLSPEQVGSLQAIQDGIRQDVEPLEAEIASLRAGIMNGEVSRVDGLVQLQDFLAQFQAAADPYRIQVETVLTPAQHGALQGIMLETRPLQGRALGAAGVGWNQGLRSGQGVWLGRGAGRGFGPGAALGMGRGYGPGLGRGYGPGMGRGYYGPGMGRGAVRGGGRGMGLRWRY